MIEILDVKDLENMDSEQKIKLGSGIARLTVNKAVKEMGMYELAHNSCFEKNGEAWYRDFNGEISARDFARELYKIYSVCSLSEDDELLDDELMEDLMLSPQESVIGLTALFYRNLWAQADLYERLKCYENLEEQGLLLRLPCKVGDIVYQITRNFISTYRIRNFIHYNNGNIFFDWECINGIYVNVQGFHIDDVGKTVFLTREEAEAALERMEK